MPKAKLPCRQLNSESIKAASLCYLTPIITGKCSVVSAQVSVGQDKKILPAWKEICKTRDKCDSAISALQNVAFFFSAISTIEVKKSKSTSKEQETDDSVSDDETTRMVASLEAHSVVLQRKMHPAVSYWICLTTPNGAPANPLVILRALLECKVQASARQVPFKEGVDSVCMKELYKVLKDHKNGFMQDLVGYSYRQCYRDEARAILDEDISMSQAELESGTENVVRLKCVSSSYMPLLAHALDKIMQAKLTLDIIGVAALDESARVECAQPKEAERRLSDKLTVLVNDIDNCMRAQDYALHRGKVYKKVDDAQFTFSFKCEARQFVNTLATNESYKARLLGSMKKIIDLMTDPYCEVIAPISIDYDLIEVNGGKCWSIPKRKFIECPIPESKIGKVSPRAFCTYDSLRDPEPKYFQDILTNSLTPEEQGVFCEDFLRLLDHNRKQHKDKVPCLVGESNSGKSSLFFPILGIVHHSNIATVTKQRSFNKAMITKFTEVIFIDEATESTLSIDDWKILTQGGFSAFDVKYETARAFINRCPMIITSQKPLKFPCEEDQKAMERRLRTYHFTALPQPKKRAADWLKRHPMDCIVWAAKQAAVTEDSASSSVDEDLNPPDEDMTLDDSEKERLRAFLPVEPLDPTATTTTSEPDNDSIQDSQDEPTAENAVADERLQAVQHVIQTSEKDTLRHRQARELMTREKQRLRQDQKRYELKLNNYKRKGVSSQNLNLVPRDDSEPDPTPVVRELKAFREAQRVAEDQQRKETCREVFQQRWVIDTERKMYDCVVTIHRTTNEDTRAGARGVLEIYSNKLKMHHNARGTLKWPEALDERRRACTSLGLLEESEQHLVTNVYEPLPLQQQQQSNTTQPMRSKRKADSQDRTDRDTKKSNILMYLKNYFK